MDKIEDYFLPPCTYCLLTAGVDNADYYKIRPICKAHLAFFLTNKIYKHQEPVRSLVTTSWLLDYAGPQEEYAPGSQAVSTEALFAYAEFHWGVPGMFSMPYDPARTYKQLDSMPQLENFYQRVFNGTYRRND